MAREHNVAVGIMPTRRATFTHNGKLRTIEPRLRESRNIVYGELPESVPFDSKEGEESIKYLKYPEDAHEREATRTYHLH